MNRNDILIFNYPINKKKIAFKINYVYAKRCVAVPGDSISAVDGYYKNSNHKGTLGNKEVQDEFNRIPEEMLPEKGKYTIPKSYEKFPWTIKNFGPIYVPRKGDVIHLNADNILLYSTIIEFETGKRISISTEGEVLADDVVERVARRRGEKRLPLPEPQRFPGLLHRHCLLSTLSDART